MSDPLADHEFGMTYNGAPYKIAVYNVRSDDDGRLLYDVLVKDADGVVVFADDFAVINPPIMVPDGTYFDYVNEDGETIQLPNMVENLVLAFELFTIDTVRTRLAG